MAYLMAFVITLTMRVASLHAQTATIACNIAQTFVQNKENLYTIAAAPMTAIALTRIRVLDD